MRQIYLLSGIIFLFFQLPAQEWLQSIPQERLQSGEVTFYELQKAFNDYWAPYNVENGYYEVNGERLKAPYWKQFKRWEWYWEPRVDKETGAFPQTSAWEELQKYLKEHPQTKSPTGNWTSLGPSSTAGGYAGLGRLNCIAFASTDPNRFYVGSPSGGIWKTTNGGSTWTPLGDQNAVLGVSDIIVVSSSGNPDIIYIGTGDRDGGSMWSLGGGQNNDNNSVGVLKSTDGGATWNSTGLSFTPSQKITVNRLLIHPTNSSILYAATSDGLYKTTDAGVNWSKINTTNFVDIAFKPGTPSTIYASNWYGDVNVSTNNGSTWSTRLSTTNNRTEIAVSANNSSVVYAVCANSNGGLAGVYKSTNSGSSFTQVFSGSTTNLLNWDCNSTASGGQGSYDLCIAADPNNANNLFIGGVNTWKSTNGGSSWSITTHWSGTCSGSATTVHADQHYMAYQNGTSNLFLCNDGGLYKTTNNGSTWNHIGTGLITSQMYRLGVAQTTPNDVITGLQDNGTKAMISSSWSDVLGGDGMECAIDPTNANHMYGEIYNGQIYHSSNHGASFSAIYSSLSGSAHWVTPYVLDPNTSGTLYIGYQDVFKSANYGSSWTKISTWGGSTLRSLAVTPYSSNYICAATQSTLYRTTNGGSTWTNITGSLPTSSSDITYVWISASNPNTIWVSLGGYNSDGVYETTNGGTTWTNISAGLPQIPVMCVIQNKQNTSQNELYAGTDVGVYVKIGSGNWTSFSNGLPNVVVTELDIYYDSNPANSKIRAATFGRGLWESDLYTNPSPVTWTGAVSSAWSNAMNWSSGTVPAALNNVTIPGSAPNMPVYTGNFALGNQCANLTIQGPASLTVTGSFTINAGLLLTMTGNSVLTIDGDWINNGSFNPGVGKVVMHSSGASSVQGNPTLLTVFTEDFETPTGWSLTGEFEIDMPGGLGGAYGGPDPSSAHMGAKVLGVDLTGLGSYPGEYENNLSDHAYTATSPVIDCSAITGTTLSFYRWLGVEQNIYDNAYIDVSNDAGTTWHQVWANPSSTIAESSWSLNTLDLSAWADQQSQVMIRFAIGTTDGGWTYCGWNIDDITVYGSAPGPETFFDLTIDNVSGGEVTFPANVTVNSNLTVKPYSRLTNGTGALLTVANDFVIEANSSGVGSFVDMGSTSVGNMVVQQQYLTSEVWHLVSSPVAGSVIGSYLNVYLKQYDETTGSWSYLTLPTSLPLNAGQGYAAWASNALTGPTLISLTGVSFNPVSFPVSGLTYTASTLPYDGFNLVGNPFPCSLEWDNTWPMSNLSGWMLVYDGGTYRGWHTSGIGYNGKSDGLIPPTQGFWIRTTSGSASLTIPDYKRLHGSQGFYKQSVQTDFPEVRLAVTANDITDEAVVLFHPEATDGWDGYFDLETFDNVEEAPSIFTLVGQRRLEVNLRAEGYEGDIVPIGFTASQAGTYYVDVTTQAQFAIGTQVYLEDVKTGSVTEIFEGSQISFEYAPEDPLHRFNLIFTEVLSGAESLSYIGAAIWSEGKTIYLDHGSINKGTIKVFDLSGRPVLQRLVNDTRVQTIETSLPAGIYLVRMQGEQTQFRAKVLIK